MHATLLGILAWCTTSLVIGGLMIWRPIRVRQTRSKFRNLPRYALD